MDKILFILLRILTNDYLGNSMIFLKIQKIILSNFYQLFKFNNYFSMNKKISLNKL